VFKIRIECVKISLTVVVVVVVVSSPPVPSKTKVTE
jgi:hypothetical protein